MTFYELLGMMKRRWYMPIAGLACAAVLTVVFLQGGSIFTTRTVVLFTLPRAPGLAPDSDLTGQNQIAFAGAIAEQINHGEPPLRYASNDAPYYGAGIRQGVVVGLPNAGGQWSNSASKAAIDIQIVGPSRDWVEQQQQLALARVEQATRALQAGSLRRSEDGITAQVEPMTTRIDEIAPARSSRVAAVIAMGFAALIAGAVGAVAIDQSSMRLGRLPQPRSNAVRD